MVTYLLSFKFCGIFKPIILFATFFLRHKQLYSYNLYYGQHLNI